MFYQYNEGEILRKLFADRFCDLDINGIPILGTSRGGVLVEVGAADGIDNSNSRELILNGWEALLIEPHPGYFLDLLKLYVDNPRVKLANYAASNTVKRSRLGLDDQCSSLVYPKSCSVEVQCFPLKDILDLYKMPRKIDFLSIDCEGEDMSIMRAFDWNTFDIDVVCVEHSMPMIELCEFMDSIGYKKYEASMGNTFFI